jgi:general secretion pathway protein J
VALFALEGWQLFYFRGNAWTNPMSAAGTTTSATTTLPDGVRLVLDLPGGQALAGRITSDWVRPTLSSADPLS